MQLEVLGSNDSPWGTRPNAQKVDFQDRPGTGPKTSPGTSPGTGPGTGPRTLVLLFSDLLVVSHLQPVPGRSRVSPRTGAGTSPGTGPETVPRPA